MRVAQPSITFLEDEFDIPQRKAVKIYAGVTFVLCHFPMLFLARGVLDEMDFWGGTFCLVLFATIEAILFAWVFGIDEAWDELHAGSELRVPRIYKFILKYITPAFLLIILVAWLIQQGIPMILLQTVSPENKPFALATRLGLIILAIVIVLLVRRAWRRRAALGTLPDYSTESGSG